MAYRRVVGEGDGGKKRDWVEVWKVKLIGRKERESEKTKKKNKSL